MVWVHWFWFVLSAVLRGLATAEFADPSDFFAGSQKRPRLKILYPENAQVLDHGDLVIKIQLDDYQLPSQLHGSSICVGLSWKHYHVNYHSKQAEKAVEPARKDDFAEQCFDEVPDFSFQAFGLSPGTQYTLRIALYERNRAIAVSVRNFRVAGIRGLLNSDEVLSIRTAVQVAMEYQTRGLEAQAEQIYRSILSESPQHADALHLLGVIFYQKGDASSAVPYIERALQSNKTFEGFHNSLGVCYRTLGRVQEAEHQFKLALALNPQYFSAVFNLGLTYQHLNRWDEAIAHFRRVTQAAAEDPVVAAQLSQQVLLDSKVRECDLLQSQMLLKEARPCWEGAQRLFPDNILVLNELGNVLSQLNDFDAAFVHYNTAFSLGSYTAELNVAHILEIQGYELESKVAFESALAHAEERGLHTYHVKVRQATVLPRILPPINEIHALRNSLDAQMTRLLEAIDEIEVDNAPPMYSGYSTGFHLLFHGLEGTNNIALKSKLYRLYSTMCPALLQGYFMELQTDTKGGSSRGTRGGMGYLEDPHSTKDRNNKYLPPGSAGSGRHSGGGGASAATAELFALGTAVPPPRRTSAAAVPSAHSTSTPTASSSAGSASTNAPGKVRIGFISRFMHTHPVGLLVQGLVEVLRNTTLTSSSAGKRDHNENTASIKDTLHTSWKQSPQLWKDHNAHHTSAEMAALNIEFEVIVFLIDGGKGTAQYDAVQRRILRDVNMAYVLPSQHIGTCAQAIRNARLDILVYPELGLDPLSYFLSYARLAPVQVAWLGHPDTTAVPSIDYFLSSHLEPVDAQFAYTEQLYKMPFFGTQFVDLYAQLAHIQEASPRTVLLNRAKFVEKLQIPKSAHLYIIAHSLCKLNPAFDEVLLRILLQDRLGYLLIIDVTSFRPSWQRLLVNRIAGKLSAEYTDRIVFQTPESAHHAVHIMQMGHVLLDPFPVTGDFQPSLEALSIGLPVVTFPSDTHIGGRFTLALYHMLGYGYQQYDATTADTSASTADPHSQPSTITTAAESATASAAGGSSTGAGDFTEQTDSDVSYSALVVSTVQEYINLALKLTHQPKLRQFHSERILRQRHRLFQQDPSALQAQWKLFAHLALQNASQRADYSVTPENMELIPDLLEIPVDLAAPPPPLLAPTRVPTFHSQYQQQAVTGGV